MPLPSVATVRRFDTRGWELWLVPALVATAGWGVMASLGPDVAMLRGLVFVGGPLLLLAGLHARLDGYLHASARYQLLPLPLPPRLHWAAAAGPHRGGLIWTGLLGLAATSAAGLSTGIARAELLGLCGDFAWLWLMAVAVEPVVPAAGAWLGRRFDEDQPEHQWQLRLGGGWTIPEAVVHLYAPALGVGLAAMLAMPGQLWLDQAIDAGLGSGTAVAAGRLGPVAVGALALAIGLGRGARWGYSRGMFGAVPWVHEATRTLAGPPVPAEVPRWLLVGRDPMRHLVVRQFWRTTPAPGLRLWALIGGAVWIALAATPSIPAAAIVLALGAVWLVPGARVLGLRRSRARLAGPLPLPPAARSGRSPDAWALLCAPVVVAVLGVAVSWGVTA